MNIHSSSTVAVSAVLVGDVRIGQNSRILHGAILDAGDGTITIGDYVTVMELAVLRATRRFPLTIGGHCIIGPHASITGATIDDEVFVATNASVFPGAKLGRGSEVRINGVVQLRSVLAPGDTVPIGWVAVGDPASILPPGSHDEIDAIQRPLDFPGFVFGVDRSAPDAMIQLTERYSRSLASSNPRED
ncbi:MAG: gamma carbonic anhydrase 3, mitochondrial-like [Microbacteriaceae bacterium]|nr:gamma carbonic anhydrase 3, mitochondrial-like [Microbacteriaceae bacterium]